VRSAAEVATQQAKRQEAREVRVAQQRVPAAQQVWVARVAQRVARPRVVRAAA
jgi:hypothetical protein